MAPLLVDANTCTYEFPGPAPLGLNVRAYYQNFAWTKDATGQYQPVLKAGGEQEILNEDPTEGFTLVSGTRTRGQGRPLQAGAGPVPAGDGGEQSAPDAPRRRRSELHHDQRPARLAAVPSEDVAAAHLQGRADERPRRCPPAR